MTRVNDLKFYVYRQRGNQNTLILEDGQGGYRISGIKTLPGASVEHMFAVDSSTAKHLIYMLQKALEEGED